MPLKLERDDITRKQVDAIVNAANPELLAGGGVCGAIFQAAGAESLRRECAPLAPVQTGEAVVTSGGNLPARWIIHTVGPVWHGGSQHEEMLLRDCYRNCLHLAAERKLASIAFPLISSGSYGYPKAQALHVAVSTIAEFLVSHEMNVHLVLFDKESDWVGAWKYQDITRFIDDHYVETHQHPRGGTFLSREMLRERLLRKKTSRRMQDDRKARTFFDLPREAEGDTGSSMTGENADTEYAIGEQKISFQATLLPPTQGRQKRNLSDVVAQVGESFSECLLRHIDEKGMKDTDAYKGANIDRKLFSKIRSRKAYSPRKKTALAFAISLQLSMDETQDLLGKAGFTLSESSRTDLIVAFFIAEGTYDIHVINEALFQFQEPILGA